MKISIFESLKSPVTPWEGTWEEIVEVLGTPTHCTSKESAEGWSPFSFSGTRRLKADCLGTEILVFDLDHHKDFADLGQRLDRHQWKYLLHETYSSTSEQPRARLVIPLSQHVAPKEYPSLWQAVASSLQLSADEACTDLARFYFANTRPPGAPLEPADTGGNVFLSPESFKAAAPTVVKAAPRAAGAPFDLEALRDELAGNTTATVDALSFVNRTVVFGPGNRNTRMTALTMRLAGCRNSPSMEIFLDMVTSNLSKRDGADESLQEWLREAESQYSRAISKVVEGVQDAATFETFFHKPDVKAEQPDWKLHLKRRKPKEGTDLGPVKPLECNVNEIISNDERWRTRVRWNVLRNCIEAVGAPVKAADVTTLAIETAAWLQKSEYDCEARVELAGAGLLVSAMRNKYDPIREYLERLPSWDGVPRIDTVLTDHGNAQGDMKWVRLITRKFFIAAIRRIMEPGCQSDSALVLSGPQGMKKTSFVRVLCGEFASDTNLDLTNKDSVLAVSSSWIVELGELSALSKASMELTRNFMTSVKDKIRPPYGQSMVEFPRRCSFVGTTNEDTPLRDPHGSRRFWVVSVGEIDIPWLKENRDQLWAEALSAYREGEQHWLDTAEAIKAANEAEVFTEESVSTAEIAAWLESKPRLPETIDAHYVHQHCLGRLPGTMRVEDSRAIFRALREMGLPQVKRTVAGKQFKCYSTKEFVDRGYRIE